MRSSRAAKKVDVTQIFAVGFVDPAHAVVGAERSLGLHGTLHAVHAELGGGEHKNVARRHLQTDSAAGAGVIGAEVGAAAFAGVAHVGGDRRKIVGHVDVAGVRLAVAADRRHPI